MEKHMNTSRIIGIVLIVGGILGISFGGFSFTRQTHEAKLGPIELSVSEKESVNVPLWASIAAIAAGAGLLLVGAKKG
jgi:drug/metabolite transporter (DMT)-like permease